MNKKLNLDFSISFDDDLPAFIEHWAGVYDDPKEHLYENNIKERLEEKQIYELYEWKYAQKIASANHKRTINDNYLQPVLNLNDYPENHPTHKELEERYLNDTQKGGPVWNIFFLHILSKNPHYNKNLRYEYPIFDKRVYHAMCFMKPKWFAPTTPFKELKKYSEGYRFEAYKKYMVLHESIRAEVKDKNRKIDKALFSFGKFLSEIEPYQRTD